MSFFKLWIQKQKGLYCLLILLITAACLAGPAMAKDTDIYQVSTKQNCYILLDNSGSMDFGVYESNVDYGAMFDYLFELNESGSPWNSYIYDTINNSSYFHDNHQETRKVFLWRGAIGVTTATIDGETVAFTGDPADPDYLWYMANLYDTHTLIDTAGNLSWDGTGTQRVTIDADGHVLLDGNRLPLGRDVKLHNPVTLYDGSQVDNGFGGLLNAPGYYFSGYEGVTAGSLDVAESGDTNIYFFVTGNWVNMQAMYNLHYTTNNPSPTGAHQGDPAWKYELVPLGSADDWSALGYSMRYPSSGNYANNLSVNDTEQAIVHPGATQIQVHFSAFDVQGDGNASVFNRDYVALYNDAGEQAAKYDNDNDPADGWSVIVSGDTVKIALSSDNSVTGTGYQIDQIRVTYHADSYLMQNRLDVAKDAMLYAIDEFHGKMNWGFATYNYTGGGSGDGAKILSALNPNLTDDANRAAIVNHVENVDPLYDGTPLGEALQDVFEQGYYIHRHALNNLLCRKNYIISLTDGYASDDNEWNRIGGVTFIDWDGDGWTADPYQYTTNPPANYYDDVGHWIYTHSWDDKTEVTDPANSYVNVTTHHIAFGSDQPLLKDAAGESGGEYIAAYNKTQLVAAFKALGQMMTEAISFTAPVVSVDAANKIQNGDDLYLGLFLPQDSQGWVGNLKKFKLGDGSAARPKIWMLYDGANNEAINSSGEFLDNTAAFWADDSDPNDSDSFGSQDVKEDGVGEVLTERVIADFNSGSYYERPIYTYASNTLTKVHRDNLTAGQLNVADDLTRDQIINYVYGYTNEADAATGAPLAYRDWALGSIVHSSPVVVDYYDPADTTTLLDRYIVVGANDGMLHVFDDENGAEVFAFIPEEILPKLQLLPTTPMVDTVDGGVTLYRSNKNPKYLIFGLRRGGKAYWCLDVTDSNPLNWEVKWQYSHAEMVQSWAKPQIAAIPVSLSASTGEVLFKDIVVFTGGYDPEEDSYPEPFFDADNSGSPFAANGNIDNAEWDKNNNEQDVNNNNDYDLYNQDMNEYGRGIFAVDIENPANVTTVDGNQVLPFSVTYGASNVTTGAAQTLTSMTFCFPATPSLVSGTFSYIYKNSGVLAEGKKGSVLNAVYAPDIYANLYKLAYRFEIAQNSGAYSLKKSGWEIAKIFSGNPGSTSSSGTFGQGTDTSDQGRKTFYAPAVSWGGACDYFDPGNYGFAHTQFSGQYDIAALYMGTGDREHPTYAMIRNRLYAIYDDSSVTAEKTDSGAAVTVTTAPYTENDLLNLSCDELDEGTILAGAITKDALRRNLTDDAEYDSAGTTALEDGSQENDAKGWYIILEDQGDATACSHCTYSGAVDDGTTADRDNHDGEKILSKVALYAGILYFTSYQPSIQDPCNPEGNGFFYSLNYCDATAGYNLNPDNDGSDPVTDVTDRYHKIGPIPGIPSEPVIIVKDGQAGGMAMGGGDITGFDPKPGDPGFRIKSPGMGLELYYWREGNSQQ